VDRALSDEVAVGHRSFPGGANAGFSASPYNRFDGEARKKFDLNPISVRRALQTRLPSVTAKR
jgi:hypothetical protein